MKTIALRASDDLHYSVKELATKKGFSLQSYIIGLIEKDLRENGAYTKSPKNAMADLLADLSEDEAIVLIENIMRKKCGMAHGHKPDSR